MALAAAGAQQPGEAAATRLVRGNAADSLLQKLALPLLQLALCRETFGLARYLRAALVDLGEPRRNFQTKPQGQPAAQAALDP